MKGIYDIKMKTPLGTEKGTLTLEPDGEKITGNLKIMNNDKDWEGKITGPNSFEFDCEVKKSVVSIPFTAFGEVADGKLTAHTNSKFGSFQITGKLRA